MDKVTSVVSLLQPGAETDVLVQALSGQRVELLPWTPSLPMEGRVGLFDVRLLSTVTRLPMPVECLLGSGRWLLIQASEPFRDDYLLFCPGVYGVMSGAPAIQSLCQALQVMTEGGLWFSRQFLAEAFQRQRGQPANRADGLPALTRREWQVVQGLLAAENNREIARRLGVEESTVKRHLYNLFRKIGVRNRLEALGWAQGVGLQAGRNGRPAPHGLSAG